MAAQEIDLHSEARIFSPACIIAGGGTGGHLFPGIAVARELEKRFHRPKILFVVGQRRMETEILSGYGSLSNRIVPRKVMPSEEPISSSNSVFFVQVVTSIRIKIFIK